MNHVEDEAENSESAAAQIVDKWLKDRERATGEKRRTGAGFHQRTLITSWLACKIKGITGNERFQPPGVEAYEAVRGRLKQARLAFDIYDALGGDGIFWSCQKIATRS